MKGDFSRDSFDASRHDYRVLMQQGRVQLDADWNEQASILLHRLESTIRDLFGSFGGPAAHIGFGLFSDKQHPGADFGITVGRYYVDGVLVENDRPCFFSEMPASAREKSGLEKNTSYIAYLDVWEEFIAPQQDPRLLDPALDGLETAARSRIVWRVRVKEIDPPLPKRADVLKSWLDPKDSVVKELFAPVGLLAATVVDVSSEDADFTPVLTGYQGSENRLYRVEIHNSGSAGTATFKWSRDNASLASRVLSIADTVITVEGFGPDARSQIKAGDWVEISDDDAGEEAASGLFAVTRVDPTMRTITVKSPVPKSSVDLAKHPVLRRWGKPPQHVDVRDDFSIALEAGIAIRFAPQADGENTPPPDAKYRAGDYWLIPARTADGGTLLWPRDDGKPGSLRPPSGVMHRYAPLASFTTDGSGTPNLKDLKPAADGTPADTDYRTFFKPLTNSPE